VFALGRFLSEVLVHGRGVGSVARLTGWFFSSG
jgi:hypothetical protein